MARSDGLRWPTQARIRYQQGDATATKISARSPYTLLLRELYDLLMDLILPADTGQVRWQCSPTIRQRASISAPLMNVPS
jgi:hypothetical protein